MTKLEQTKEAIDNLILAVAHSLKEAVDNKDDKTYKVMQKFLMPLGNFGSEVDELIEKVKK